MRRSRPAPAPWPRVRRFRLHRWKLGTDAALEDDPADVVGRDRMGRDIADPDVFGDGVGSLSGRIDPVQRVDAAVAATTASPSVWSTSIGSIHSNSAWSSRFRSRTSTTGRTRLGSGR